MSTCNIIREYEDNMRRYFEVLASQHSPKTVKRVGWSSRHTQITRFDVLCGIGPLQGRSVLDVGCGVGDFYGYLMKIGFQGEYMGYDLLPANCRAATQKYGNKFFPQNILETKGEKEFDYVVASGIFFLPSDHWEEIVSVTLKRMYSLCKIGIAANFLSICSAPENLQSFHIHPGKIIDICTQITDVFKIQHDYAAKRNDFTLFAYREINPTNPPQLHQQTKGA